MRRLSWFLFAAVALAWLASAAGAVTMPGGMDVTWQVNGATAPFTGGVTNDCTTGGDVTDCAGNYSWMGAALTWDGSWDPDPFIDGVFGVTNNTTGTQTYNLTFTLSVSPAITPSTLTGASVIGNLTVNGDGGTLGHNGSNAMFTALIDGVPYDTLLPFDSSVTLLFGSGSTGADSFGLPGLTQPGPAVNSSIAIQLQFTLTPGDSASFTSRFEVVQIPEPTTIGLVSLGLAGLALAGRRRRA